MTDTISTFILDEGKWLFISLIVAVVSAAVLLVRRRSSGTMNRVIIQDAMNLSFGLVLGTMSVGHLLAVTYKLVSGTLDGSTTLFYLIGLALAIPSFGLITHAIGKSAGATTTKSKTIVLNAWIAGTLLVMGLHNLPLAALGFLNIGYALHTNNKIGWSIVTLYSTVIIALLVASIVFFASGLTFEEFRGI